MGTRYGILYWVISVLVIAAVSGLLTYATARAAPSTPTSTNINSYLAEKSSPLAGTGAAFVQRGLELNVDPRLVVAIAGAESTFGKNICAKIRKTSNGEVTAISGTVGENSKRCRSSAVRNLAGSSPLRISHRASSPMIATGRSARDNASTIAVATVIPRSVDSDP